MQVISEYAFARRIQIIRIYSDAARSGLTLQGRDSLLQLISDVESGRADFQVILVYDVSRWGRFQNVDEGAHYEFICRRAGVGVEYCADGFRNDGSIVSTLLKDVKRTMAAEHSRELSAKVSRAKLRLAQMGYFQGGATGFGLRRMLVDHDGNPKGILEFGQKKSLQEDRVVLTHGPDEEVQTVREIFRLYVDDQYSPSRIARHLNEKRALNGRGKPWSFENVDTVLRSERYIGNLDYNRSSAKLRSARGVNPERTWVRAPGVMAPLVDPAIFAAAQRRRVNGTHLSDIDLLNHLIAVWCVRGYLSCNKMQSVPGTPSPNTYRDRFGSVENAFRLLGYQRIRSYRYEKCSGLLQRLNAELVCRLVSAVESCGGSIRVEPDHLRIDQSISVSITLVPYTNRPGRRAGWWLFFDRVARSQLIFVVRMDSSNKEILDYHLFPFPTLCGPTFRFDDIIIAALRRYRLSALAEFFDACRERLNFKHAAE